MTDGISIAMSDDGLSIEICAGQNTKKLLQPVMKETYKTLVEFIEVSTVAKRSAPGLERELIELLLKVREHASDIVDVELDQTEPD